MQARSAITAAARQTPFPALAASAKPAHTRMHHTVVCSAEQSARTATHPYTRESVKKERVSVFVALQRQPKHKAWANTNNERRRTDGDGTSSYKQRRAWRQEGREREKKQQLLHCKIV